MSLLKKIIGYSGLTLLVISLGWKLQDSLYGYEDKMAIMLIIVCLVMMVLLLVFRVFRA